MKLRPQQTKPLPRYPSSFQGLLRRARALGCATSAAAALALSGCGAPSRSVGTQATHTQAGDPDANALQSNATPTHNDAGDAAAAQSSDPATADNSEHNPSDSSATAAVVSVDLDLERCEPFVRMSGDPEPVHHFSCVAAANLAPLNPAPLHGSPVPACASGAALARVEVAQQMRAQIMFTDQYLHLALFDPLGRQVLELGPGPTCVELNMGPGIWVFSARTPGAPANWGSGFDFFPTGP